MSRGPLIIANRGASAAAPPNTLSAFETAVGYGADLVRVNVHLSVDEQLVITDERDAGAMTYQELLAASPHARRPPLLREAVELLAGRAAINADVASPAAAAPAARLLAASRDRDRALLTSFHPRALRRARQAAPGLSTGLMVGRYLTHAMTMGRIDLSPWRTVTAVDCQWVLGADWLMRCWLTASACRPANAAARNVELATWTLNRPGAIARASADRRLGALITDTPDVARFTRQETLAGRRVAARDPHGRA